MIENVIKICKQYATSEPIGRLIYRREILSPATAVNCGFEWTWQFLHFLRNNTILIVRRFDGIVRKWTEID